MLKSNELQPIEMQIRPPVISTPESDKNTRSAIIKYYNNGDWRALKDICEITISSFVKDLPNPIVSGSTIFSLFHGAIAYKNESEFLKYRASLKLLFSLNQFFDRLNKNDQELIQTAVNEYLLIAKEDGPEVLNSIEVREILKKSSGCFIATAVYGTPYANDVILLNEFRDNWLLNFRLGKIFVHFYYWISPPIANQITKSNSIRAFIKFILIIPLIRIAQYLKRKEE